MPGRIGTLRDDDPAGQAATGQQGQHIGLIAEGDEHLGIGAAQGRSQLPNATDIVTQGIQQTARHRLGGEPHALDRGVDREEIRGAVGQGDEGYAMSLGGQRIGQQAQHALRAARRERGRKQGDAQGAIGFHVLATVGDSARTASISFRHRPRMRSGA